MKQKIIKTKKKAKGIANDIMEYLEPSCKGEMKRTSEITWYCECKRNYKGIVVCSKCGLWKKSSLSTNKKLTRQQMKDILWNAYHPDGIKNKKYDELFKLGVYQGYWEKPSQKTEGDSK